jgi:hypothetical protein
MGFCRRHERVTLRVPGEVQFSGNAGKSCFFEPASNLFGDAGDQSVRLLRRLHSVRNLTSDSLALWQ